MRVGYLTYALDRSPTGIGRYALELLCALDELPERPELVLLRTERADPHGLWRRFASYPLRGCGLLPLLMTLGNLWLRRAAVKFKLDVIHDPNGIAPFLLSHPGTRHAVTLHDALPFVDPQTHNRLDTWRYRHMLPRALRRADRILTDSQHSFADLRQHLGLDAGRMEVVYCGVNQRFQPVRDPAALADVQRRYGLSQPYLLYLGGINGRKNIARLLEAYALVRRERPDVTLVVGGVRQWQTTAIDAALERLGLRQHVCFPGYIDDGDLPALYSAAAVFVFPSLYEGFGIPPLEAMACGTPVVTSNSSSLPEVVGEAALQIDPLNVDALAAAILLLLADPALREDLGERGRRRASLFTWQRTAESLLAVYAGM